MFTFVTSAAKGESVYFDVFTVDGKRIAKGVKSLDGIARGFSFYFHIKRKTIGSLKFI